MPNFLIIGAPKAGTSSLYYYLKQHPQIYMSSVKEPHFFALEGNKFDYVGPTEKGINRKGQIITNLEEYKDLFKEVSNEIAIGEASPIYLHSLQAPVRIKHYIPNAKLIAVLRHPAERAFSAFSHLVREGYETLSFEQALIKEQERINNKWLNLFYYQKLSFYYESLKRYFNNFNKEKIQIYLYEDFRENTIDIVRDIFSFLEVNNDFVPDLTIKNASGIPKSRFLYDLFTKKNFIKSISKPFFTEQLRRKIYDRVTTQNLGSKPTMPSEIKHNLINIYREDILKLQDLIQRDLSHWLK
ncbi:sulfotransferase [Pleurocapsa sp. PCC 7319]|uniref:sulfotransferase family protein n=1 Tax=Pleurocapsa sp. PCC 7319 TaxID=118161 RepID=UPI00037A38BB|nr:sulfotransferase [Pleurocapsa sp. PCC 7319]